MNTLPSRAELVEMILAVMNPNLTDEEINILLFELEEIYPLSDVSDLIFYSENELSAEEIADAILSYKPLLLPR